METVGKIVRWILALVLAGLIIAMFSPSFHVHPPGRGEMSRNLNYARQLVLASRAYTLDSDGEWPERLTDLYPDYIDDNRLLRFHEPDHQVGLPWIYIRPSDEDPPPDTIILKSPTTYQGKTLIARIDGIRMEKESPTNE